MSTSSYFHIKNTLDAVVAAAYTGRNQEKPMSPTPSRRRWLRKFWGAVCVIVGLVSIAAGLESVILE